MKRVILIGDSTMIGSDVSSGYSPFLADELGDSFRITLPLENCQDTRFTASCLDELFEREAIERADVIHWNNGLWDTLHFLGSKRCVVPLEKYVANLDRIYGMLRGINPTAKIIFATSTPVPECEIRSSTYRLPSDINAYNAAACELLAAKGVIINDLNLTVSELGDGVWLSDGVHLKDEVSRILAVKVSEAIRGVFI